MLPIWTLHKKARTKTGDPGTALRQTVETASSYGSYMPVIVNGVAIIMHVDSGANHTQFSPDMFPVFQGTLTKLDSGKISFDSAEGRSSPHMSLYLADSVALLQIEAGIKSISVTSKMICNTRLREGTILLGLNTLRALKMMDNFANDTLLDALDRPFRKTPPNRLRTLKQQVGVWNRKQTQVYKISSEKSTQNAVSPFRSRPDENRSPSTNQSPVPRPKTTSRTRPRQYRRLPRRLRNRRLPHPTRARTRRNRKLSNKS